MAETTQANASEAKLLSDDRFLRRVAYLYYEDGNSQEVIASKENCSRQAVGKALQRAREQKIVRITINPDPRGGYLRNLSREVRMELDLQDLILVPGQNLETIDADAIREDVVIDIASTAAEYLDQLLGADDILAVSGGTRFMRNLVRFIKPNKLLPQMRVVPTIGFADAHTNLGDANLIAHDIAQIYGTQHYWFACPAFLGDAEQVQRTRQLPIIKEVYELMVRASVVVTGLWTPQTDTQMEQQSMITPAQIEAIRAYEPVADINHWMFDAKGRCINELLKPPPYFLSGLEIPRLKQKIQQTGAKVILLAGGSPAYIPAIRAVLKAGLANILVTDHVTAQLLLMNA